MVKHSVDIVTRGDLHIDEKTELRSCEGNPLGDMCLVQLTSKQIMEIYALIKDGQKSKQRTSLSLKEASSTLFLWWEQAMVICP